MSAPIFLQLGLDRNIQISPKFLQSASSSQDTNTDVDLFFYTMDAPDAADTDLKTILLQCKAGIDSLNNKFDKLETKVSKLEERADIVDERLNVLEEKINEREQHSRNSSIRIFGYKLDPETSKDAIKTCESVYSSVLRPILQIAVKNKVLDSMPAMNQLIEYGHTLPARKDKDGVTQPCPIIIRFQSRLHRLLVFRYKKEYLPNNRREVSIVDDLTAKNVAKLRELKNNANIDRAWSTAGKLFYTLKDSPGQKRSAKSPPTRVSPATLLAQA